MPKKRNQLTKVKIGILAVVCFCAMLSALLQEHWKVGFLPVGGKNKSVACVVIDAGHGGPDGGAVGIHGEIEKEINLEIAKELRDFLTLSGIEVVMTREEDISIHDKSAKGIAKQKASDIRNRLELMEKHPDALVVSIHQNHFTQEKYHGAQMFYGKNNPNSEVAAQSIQDAFVKYLQPDNQRQIKPGTKSVYLLEHATVPIVLVECGFLSNGEEAVLLNQKEYQEKIAFTVYCGIVNFFRQQNGVEIKE